MRSWSVIARCVKPSLRARSTIATGLESESNEASLCVCRSTNDRVSGIA